MRVDAEVTDANNDVGQDWRIEVPVELISRKSFYQGQRGFELQTYCSSAPPLSAQAGAFASAVKRGRRGGMIARFVAA